MGLTDDEYTAYVKAVQRQEQQREDARRRQEDFKVFISYSHSDEEAARRITDMFDTLNMKNYVIDKKSIEWGDDIRDFAIQKIAQCTHYLLILSEASAKSKWCALEFGIALGADKKVLLFLTTDDIEVPGYATNVLATSNIDVVKGYFSQSLIRPEAVEKLVAEIIDDEQATLSEFKRVDTYASGCMRWDAPDRAAIESEKRDFISAYIDDYRDQEFWRLVSIELRQPFEKTAVILHYSCPGWRPRHYELSYRPELEGIVATPEKNATRMMGVRLSDDEGTDYFVNRTPSFQEQIESRGVYGWRASRSFWERTFEVLKGKLAA